MRLRYALLSSVILLSTNVLADDDIGFTNYDSIVNELNASMDETPVSAQLRGDFNWQDVALHGGLGFATSYVNLTSPGGSAGTGLLKGVQLGFGVNLFTRDVRAEGIFSSYAQEELANNLKADLKEFELRLIYLPELAHATLLRFGAGITARYMSIDSRERGNWNHYEASTPSSVFLLGLERQVTPSVSCGPDISYRSALVSDTFDKSSWDASFRLNATF